VIVFAAAEGVGLDPQVGFLHAIRSGRPALALTWWKNFESYWETEWQLLLINRRQNNTATFWRKAWRIEYT